MWEVHWKFGWLDSPSCLLGWESASCSGPRIRIVETGVRGFCPWHLLEDPHSLLSLFLLFLVPQMASDSLGLLRLLLTVQSPPGENSEWSGQWRFTFWTGQVEWGADTQHTGAFLLGRRLARGIRWRGATSGCSILLLCRFSAFSFHCLLCVVTWVMKWELEEICCVHVVHTCRQLDRSAPER